MRRRHYFEDSDRDDVRLALDPVNRKLGGVCAGVARYLDVPTFWVRLAAVVALLVFPEPILLAYGIAYLVLDKEP